MQFLVMTVSLQPRCRALLTTPVMNSFISALSLLSLSLSLLLQNTEACLCSLLIAEGKFTVGEAA